MSELRDLLYFDFEKAASLLSQLEGGLPDRRSESSERIGDQRNLRTYDLLKLFKAEFGGTTSEKTSLLESRLLHHDLLNRVEAALERLKVIVDLNEALSEDVESPEEIRAAIGYHDYMRAEGWVAFEDYERLKDLSTNFNDLIAFITRCSLDEIKAIEHLREEAATYAATGKQTDKQRKQRLRAQEQAVQKEIKEKIQKAQLPEWLFEGIRLWIAVYLDGRLNLRLFPFENVPDFEIIANLKRDCFIDDNLGHLIYGYGTYPNKKLTVFGLVTSTPEKNVPQFDASAVIEDVEEDSDETKLEVAFRRVFAAMEGLEKFSTFHRYPRVIVHPIAVFRSIRVKNS